MSEEYQSRKLSNRKQRHDILWGIFTICVFALIGIASIEGIGIYSKWLVSGADWNPGEYLFFVIGLAVVIGLFI